MLCVRLKRIWYKSLDVTSYALNAYGAATTFGHKLFADEKHIPLWTPIVGTHVFVPLLHESIVKVCETGNKPYWRASYDAHAISLVSPEPWQTTTGNPRSSGCSRTVTETKKQSMSTCMMIVSVRFMCSPNTTCSCPLFRVSVSFFS